MILKGLIKKTPFFKDCIQYNIPMMQCPSFLFFIMGLVNILAMLGTYAISNRFTNEPEITALITIVVSILILVIGTTIVNGFDKLLQANKMKNEFIRIASHQLRTPLASLRWSLDLLTQGTVGKPTAEQVEYLQIIKESNQRMIKLVNDLLDVTKIEMGSLTIELKPVDLKSVIEKVVEELKVLARANNIAVDVDIDADLPMVLSDQDKIKMVITNLLDNAIKYTKGPGKISIGAGRDDSFVKVFVKDTGVGIPKEQQPFIFQKFFRSDNVMKHQTVGSGLGLFIVKAIVDSNKGQIWFESGENKGTTFFFKIPISK